MDGETCQELSVTSNSMSERKGLQKGYGTGKVVCLGDCSPEKQAGGSAGSGNIKKVWIVIGSHGN